MSSTINPDEKLQLSKHGIERSDILTLFVKMVNLCEPDHMYDFEYPIKESDVEFSWTTKYWARCGPQKTGAYYAINMTWAEKQSIENLLSTTVHEIGHLNYGVEYNQPGHPPKFWEAMARYAKTATENWDKVNSWLENSADLRIFKRSVVNDPNAMVVDRRIETVGERRKKQAKLLEENPEEMVR